MENDTSTQRKKKNRSAVVEKKEQKLFIYFYCMLVSIGRFKEVLRSKVVSL